MPNAERIGDRASMGDDAGPGIHAHGGGIVLIPRQHGKREETNTMRYPTYPKKPEGTVSVVLQAFPASESMMENARGEKRERGRG